MNSLGANNRVRSAILTAVALPAAVAAWLLISRAEAEKESNRSDNVIEIVSDDIEEVVTAQGKLEPKNYGDVGAQVSGQLKTVRVAIGDNIKEGDLIAEIDPQIYEARLAANEARLRTLEAQRVEQQVIADQAQQMRGRNEKLQKSGAVSKQAFEDEKRLSRSPAPSLLPLRHRSMNRARPLRETKPASITP